MLTEEKVKQNKDRFIELIKSISIEGANIDGLISFLEKSDFFTAPASTQYHYSFKGGLCEHSLNVYSNLIKIVDTFAMEPKTITSTTEDGIETEENLIISKYSSDTLKIVGLLHDLSKVNFYEKYVQNKKVYSPDGSKYDEMGKYDWVSSEAYKVIDSKDRMIAGSKGMNSFLLVSRFIPLEHEEVVALVNQYAGSDKAENTEDLPSILNKYNLAVYLHMADTVSTYCTEKYNE
jgi:hypothetical protein